MNATLENKYDASPYRIPMRNKFREIVEYAIVDADDFERVSQYPWRLSHGYASGTVEGRSIFMHHFVFKKPSDGKVIDHINNDRLDNRKNNLREATRAENSHNVSKRSGTSQYKGVSLYNGHVYENNAKKYSARYASKHLGLYDDEESAAKAYDTYTYVLHGEKACNNQLIKYEDVAHLKLSDLSFAKQEDLPKHIYRISNKYYALKKYNKKTYKGEMQDTLEDALEDLWKILFDINYKKVMEEFFYRQTPIVRNDEGIAVIQCTGGVCLVDDKDWHTLNRYSWYIDNGYVDSSVVGRMHRFLLKPKRGQIIDHINQNKKDNRRSNLRIASYSLNNHNRPKKEGGTSIYKGVRRTRDKWTASISHNYQVYPLGEFDTELEAHEAYQKKAKELHGI